MEPARLSSVCIVGDAHFIVSDSLNALFQTIFSALKSAKLLSLSRMACCSRRDRYLWVVLSGFERTLLRTSRLFSFIVAGNYDGDSRSTNDLCK